ncbi:MAG: stage 0 sporulation protein [Nitrospira bacterium SG8_3]|jgi:cell fate regulator YaaT (PSP1 superfamily)|nr:MAG: stage 0 sporulation protein [Nitrospira bacterium SG8_3]
MAKIVGIRFSPQGKVYDFDVGHFVLSPGSRVIVETQQGLGLGTVVTPPRPAGDRQSKSPLKKVYRLANDEDVKQHRRNLELAEAAQAYCLKCIKQLGLGMNLVSVENLLDGTKLVFYYTADGRVDFRELVKMLVKQYRVRVEMRQIGVRNRAKMCGGIGRCGHELCCCRFINDFHPVSVRMAKEQGLSLNPTKISGLCGRLMCCLGFEHGIYCDLKAKFPAFGKEVETKRGRGRVIRQNVLKESITVQLEEGGEVDVSLHELTGETNSSP